MAGVNYEVFGIPLRDAEVTSGGRSSRVAISLLFRDDNNGCIQVHVDVDRLVSLQSILETGSRFSTNTFESLTRSILEHTIRPHSRASIPADTYQERLDRFQLAGWWLEESVNSLDVPSVIDDFHISHANC